MENYVRFDGKHWVESLPIGKILRVSFSRFSQQALNALGKRGIVGIVNARGGGHPEGVEYRYEQFIGLGKELGRIEMIGDGRVAKDNENGIYFVKGQELNLGSLVLIAYNIPFGQNLMENPEVGLEETLKQASELECILGITAPSCIDSLPNILERNPYLIDHIDFVIGWSGGAKKEGDNYESLELYEKTFKDKEKGVIAVSGGHRTPGYFWKIIAPQTLGTNYIQIPAPDESAFIEDFRKGLKNSKDISQLERRMNYRETYLRHGLRTKINKLKKKLRI